MRIAVVAHDYPTPGSNAGAFIQARVDLYRRMGHAVDVYARQHRNAWRPADVIQVHYPLPEYNIPFVREHRGTAPVVVFLHGAEAIWTPGKPLLWGARARSATRRFVKSCDAAVTVSRWMQAQVEAYLGLKPIVIPNVVDPQLFAIFDGARPPNALCLRGRLVKYGVDVLRAAIDQGLLDGKRVRILDPKFPRAELPALLRDYEVFVAPSRLEGQGLMACEACVSGVKVTTTRVGGIPEFFEEDDAVFITELTPEAIAAALARTFAWRPDLQALRERMLARCGPEATVRKEVDLMESLFRR